MKARRLMKIFAPVALALTLVGCAESPQDLARKPDIVAQMVENSTSICERGPVHADKPAYAERLTKILTDAKTANLKTLQDNNVTVCLDQRLSGQVTSFWTWPMNGVYYADKDGGIATLWDDGRQSAEVGFLSIRDAYFRGYHAVDRLADKIRSDGRPSEGFMTAYEYGKGRHVNWDIPNPVKGAIAKNPQLLTPPVQKAPQKPGT